MSLETNIFEFGEFVLDRNEKVLLRQGRPVAITPKVFELLLVLLENRGHLVEKQKLMDSVWAGSFVEDSNLTFTMRQLRKVLGDDKQNPKFIETLPRRGYRFVASQNGTSAVNPSPPEINGNGNRPAAPKSIRRALGWLGAVSVGIVVLTAVFVGNSFLSATAKSLAGSESAFSFETLDSFDSPISAAISPDGKYLSYTRPASGVQALWLRQLSNGVNTQLISTEEGVSYYGLKFSADSESVYFARRFKNDSVRIDRISIADGSKTENIIRDIDGEFSLSRDGKYVSFRRYGPQRRTLHIANIDGSGERQIFETSETITGNSFSPDNTKIAFAMGQSDTGDRNFRVYVADLVTGNLAPSSEFAWLHVGSVIWSPDADNLLVTGYLPTDKWKQLWQVSLTNGEVRKVAESQLGVGWTTATADFDKILLIKVARSAVLYTADAANPNEIKPAATAYEGSSWTPDGSIVFVPPNGRTDVWELTPDRKEQRQMTATEAAEYDPVVSPDGRFIAFVSNRGDKYHIWRADRNGRNLVELTHGDGEQEPEFTADSRFVLFNSMRDGSLWRVPVEGGDTQLVFEGPAHNVSVSPDGGRIAHHSKVAGVSKIVVRNIDSGAVEHEYDIPKGYFAGRDIVWAKDGLSFYYAAEDFSRTANLWRQQLAGGTPVQVTKYKSEEIFSFSFSPAGSELALVRGSWRYDLVLMKTGLQFSR